MQCNVCFSPIANLHFTIHRSAEKSVSIKFNMANWILQSIPITRNLANLNCFSFPLRVRVTVVLLYQEKNHKQLLPVWNCVKKLEFPLRLLAVTSSDLSSNFFSCTVLTCGYVILLESHHAWRPFIQDAGTVHLHYTWISQNWHTYSSQTCYLAWFCCEFVLYSNALLNQMTNQLYYRKYSSLGARFYSTCFLKSKNSCWLRP